MVELSSPSAEDDEAVYDVAVIGLGPVGAVAALLLAREGLSVVAVEPSRMPYDKPRALGIDHESLRLLQAIGVTDGLSVHMGDYRPSEYLNGKGELLRRIIPAPEPHPLAWPPYSTFIQPELELLLRAQIESARNIRTVYGARCIDVWQDADEVEIALDTQSDNIPAAVRARYAIGCDGAWSPVREALEISLEDLEFDEPWLVIDMLVDDDIKLPEATTQYCDPARPATFVRGPANLRRWEIMLLPGEDPAAMIAEDMIWSLLERWLRPNQGKIWRAATYRFHALVARRWHEGRVFIAGDAAHQTPPFMAQGLNQGFRDVGNLCWKLGQVIRHGAAPAILESYDIERRPNARAVIELTKRLGRVICERDGEAASRRDAEMLAEMAAGTGEIIRQDMLPALSGGLTAGSGEYDSLNVAAGTIFPQPWIATSNGDRRLDDVLDRRFLLVIDSTEPPTEATADHARALGVLLASTEPVSWGDTTIGQGDRGRMIATWMRDRNLASALVRPDHVVFGGSKQIGQEDALLDRLDAALYGA